MMSDSLNKEKSIYMEKRKSPVLLIFNIFWVNVFFEVIYFFSRFFVNNLSIADSQKVVVHMWLTIAFIFITTIQIFLTIYIALQWVNEYFIIQENELVYHRGIFNRDEISYPYNNIQSLDIEQSFIERIFHIGKIKIYIPTLGQTIVFNGLSDPDTFADLVKQAIPYFKSNAILFMEKNQNRENEGNN